MTYTNDLSAETNRQAPRSIDVRPRNLDEAVKPVELIEISGHADLTLHDRRAITLLYRNAALDGIAQGKDYEIEIDLLKPADHKGNEQVEATIDRLMKTVVHIGLRGGGRRKVQLLGGNDLDDPDRPRGMLRYSFDKRLVEMLSDSKIWGRIEIPVIMAFGSRYSVSLYENLARFLNLQFKNEHTFTVAEFRDMLGVPATKYKSFGELNLHVIRPTVLEVNALASFALACAPVKEGRRVTKLRLVWYPKGEAERKAASDELNRPKVGRRARISGTVDMVLDPITARQGPQHLDQEAKKRAVIGRE